MGSGVVLNNKPLLDWTVDDINLYLALKDIEKKGKTKKKPGLILYPGHYAYESFAAIYPPDPKTKAVTVPNE